MPDPAASESSQGKSKLKGLVAQGLIGAVSLAGATAIPIVIKQVLEKPAVPTTPAVVASPVVSPIASPTASSIASPIASPNAIPSLPAITSPSPISTDTISGTTEVNTMQLQSDKLIDQTQSDKDNKHQKGKGRKKDP